MATDTLALLIALLAVRLSRRPPDPRRPYGYARLDALGPLINGALPFVVAGSIVMEQVFTYPGIGKLMFQAVTNNDYALMQGLFLVITITVLAANFFMDLIYGFIDPRARQNV